MYLSFWSITACSAFFHFLEQVTATFPSPVFFVFLLYTGLLTAYDGKKSFIRMLAVFSVLDFANLPFFSGYEDFFYRWCLIFTDIAVFYRFRRWRLETKEWEGKWRTHLQEAKRWENAISESLLEGSKDALTLEEQRRSSGWETAEIFLEAERVYLAFLRRSLGLWTAAVFHRTVLGGKETLRLVAADSACDAVARDRVLQIGEGLPGLAARERRVLILDPLAQESARVLPYYLKPQKVRGFAAFPLGIEERTADDQREQKWIGLLVVDAQETGMFQGERLELLHMFVRLLQEHFQTARLVHFSKMKSRDMEILFRASQVFVGLKSVQEVLKTTVKTTGEMLPHESVWLFWWDKEKKAFRLRAWQGPPPSSASQENAAQVLGKWIVERKRPVRYQRIRKDEFQEVSQAGRGFLAVPLQFQEETLGYLRVDRRDGQDYRFYDEQLLLTLANQSALALENVYLMEAHRHLAERDGLTGLYNHRYFQDRLLEEVRSAERYNNDLTLAMLDVDHFKKFNDTFGHQEGDSVLKGVARLLQKNVREHVDIVARYGGEEFAVIMPKTDQNAAKVLGERIRRAVADHFFEKSGGGVYRVTVSIGLASYPFDAREPQNLIHCADEALYASKRDGRNRLTTFAEWYQKKHAISQDIVGTSFGPQGNGEAKEEKK